MKKWLLILIILSARSFAAIPTLALGSSVTDFKNLVSSLRQGDKDRVVEVHLLQGRYEFSSPLDLTNVHLVGVVGTVVSRQGGGFEGAFMLSGSAASVKDLRVELPKNVPRQSAGTSAAIFVRHCDQFSIQNVSIDGGASAGVLVFDSGSGGSVIAECRIANTGADGIHITGASSNVKVERCHVSNTGDDFIAIVSYVKDRAICKGIEILSNQCGSQKHGRGISVVGGSGILISENKISSSFASGIYVSSETSYDTSRADKIVISGNVISNAVMGREASHAAILIASRGDDEKFATNTVLVSSNEVQSSNGLALSIGPMVAKVTVSSNSFNSVASDGVRFMAESKDICFMNNRLNCAGDPLVFEADSVSVGFLLDGKVAGISVVGQKRRLWRSASGKLPVSLEGVKISE